MSFWRELWCYITTGHRGQIVRDHTGNINHKCDNCGKLAHKYSFVPDTTKVVVEPFKWIEDYGPYWKPNSTAFWLEPKTREDLLAWFERYQPNFSGTFTVNDITVSINRKRDYILIQSDRRKQDTSALSQMYYAQMQMSNRRQQGLLSQQQASNMYNSQDPLGLGGLGGIIGRIGL